MNKHVKRLLVFLCVVASLAFVLVLIISFGESLDQYNDNCLGALAGGCVVALAILIHGLMTRQPPRE